MARVKHIVKFIPCSAVHPYLPRDIDVKAVLDRLDAVLDKAFEDLLKGVPDDKVLNVGISMSNVVVGHLSGVLIAVYVLIKDD